MALVIGIWTETGPARRLKAFGALIGACVLLTIALARLQLAHGDYAVGAYFAYATAASVITFGLGVAIRLLAGLLTRLSVRP